MAYLTLPGIFCGRSCPCLHFTDEGAVWVHNLPLITQLALGDTGSEHRQSESVNSMCDDCFITDARKPDAYPGRARPGLLGATFVGTGG